MYKKFSIKELTSIKNNLIPHLYSIIQREKFTWVNDFFKIKAFHEWDEVLYFEKGSPLMKIELINDNIHITDEIDNIQIEVPFNNKSELDKLVKSYISKNKKQSWLKTVEQILMDSFIEGNFYSILWKPYLVYDIETSLISWEISEKNFPEFYIWYSMEEISSWKMQYECIMKDQLWDFVNRMLNFDGYIIGFNQIYFDNPVCIYNTWLTNSELEKLNEKSLDLYVFFHQLTNKRMWLNKISDSLIWVKKTLDSWADVESLRKEWNQSWDKKILKTIQEYCKNDVRMTALVLLYLLHFKKVDLDNESFLFDIDKLIEISKPIQKKQNNQNSFKKTSLF